MNSRPRKLVRMCITSHQNKLEPEPRREGFSLHSSSAKPGHALGKLVAYFTYSTQAECHGNSKPSQAPHTSQAQPRRNGCTSASFGMMRLAGSRARHRSSKSTNDVKSLRSSSFICADEGGISLARKSRVGFDMCTLRTTSLKNL